MKKWQNILVQVLKALEQLMTGILVIVMIAVIGAVYVPKILGYAPYKVQTGSMEPKYKVGCMVYVKSVTPDELQVGDAVTFDYSGLTVTHQIISIDEENKEITTKGLANKNTSETFSYSSIIGRASNFSIPYAGYILEYLSTNQIKYILLIYVLGLLLLMTINKYLPKCFRQEITEAATKEGDNNG